MEPIMIFVITAIIIAILLVTFNKQQEAKASNNWYANDVKQLYMLTAAEYKINALENRQPGQTGNANQAGLPNIPQELNRLKTAFDNGEIPLNELNSKLDYLLNILNPENPDIARAC